MSPDSCFDYVRVVGQITLQVSTVSASNIENDTVDLTGEVESLGGANSADVYHEYRETGASSFTQTPKDTVSTAQQFTDTVTGLSSKTQYEFRSVAETTGETAKGNLTTFTTGAMVVEYSQNGSVFETDRFPYQNQDYDEVRAFLHSYGGDSASIAGSVANMTINGTTQDFTTFTESDPDNVITNITANSYDFDVSDLDADSSLTKSATGNVNTLSFELTVDSASGNASGFDIGVVETGSGGRCLTSIAYDGGDGRLDSKTYSDQLNSFLNADFGGADFPVTITITATLE
jgi:subtilisin